MLSDTMMLGGGRKAAYPMENSLLFRGRQSYLYRVTTAADPVVTKASLDAWVRFASGKETHLINWTHPDKNHAFCAWVRSNGQVAVGRITRPSTDWLWGCSSVETIRDASGFVHFHLDFDTTRENSGDRVQCWVNGRRLTLSQDSTLIPGVPYPAKDEPIYCCIADAPLSIGRYGANDLISGDMVLASYALVTGGNADHTLFGEGDPITGSWRPKKVVGISWGANGSYLCRPWSSASLGADSRVLGNNWMPIGFAAFDVLSDSPTNVYATLNPLSKAANAILSAGNLAINSASSGQQARATVAVKSGKWAWMQRQTTAGDGTLRSYIGIVNGNASLAYDGLVGIDANGWGWRLGGQKWTAGNGVSYGTAGTVGDWQMCAFDADTGKLWFGLNGTWFGNPEAGTSPAFTVPTGEFYYPACSSDTDHNIEVNFGQRLFAFSLPAGFKPLSTANMPATTGQTSGSFTGNASADGPCVYTGAVPALLWLNNRQVTWGTHADKLATGFKIRTSDSNYNASGTNTWTATYGSPQKPTVGPKGRAPANAQANP